MAEPSWENLKPNSHVSRAAAEAEEKQDIQRKKLDSVGTGRSKPMKPPFLKRLKNTFIDDDFTPANLKDYVVKDVVAPAIQNAIMDGVNGALEMAFGIGIVRRGTRRVNGVISSKTPYRNSGNSRTIINNGSASVSSQSAASERRSKSTFEPQMKDNKKEADDIMISLEALLEEQPDAGVSVSDYYDAFGVTTEHTDNKYGWYDLSGMRLQEIRNAFYDEDTRRYISGWAVIMPPEQPLDQ